MKYEDIKNEEEEPKERGEKKRDEIMTILHK